MITRRAFFKSIVPAAVGGLVLAEELLHPGRTFFLPPRQKYFTWDVYEDITFPPLGLGDIDVIVKRHLAADLAATMDAIAFKTFSQGSAFYKVGINHRGAPAFRLLEATAGKVSPLLRFREQFA